MLLQKILCENASRTAESSCLKMNEPRISLIFAYQAFEIVTVLGSKNVAVIVTMQKLIESLSKMPLF